jgi:hypothetical protein
VQFRRRERIVAPREVFDRLLLPVLEDLEVVGGQVRQEHSFAVGDGDAEGDKIRLDAEGRLPGGNWRQEREEEAEGRDQPGHAGV